MALKRKVEFLRAVDEGNRTKEESWKSYGVPNCSLSTVLKIRQNTTIWNLKIIWIRLQTFKYSNYERLETALLSMQGLKPNPSKTTSYGKANIFAELLDVQVNANSGWLEDSKKKRNWIISKIF